jgi:hypothetical protein
MIKIIKADIIMEIILGIIIFLMINILKLENIKLDNQHLLFNVQFLLLLFKFRNTEISSFKLCFFDIFFNSIYN